MHFDGMVYQQIVALFTAISDMTVHQFLTLHDAETSVL